LPAAGLTCQGIFCCCLRKEAVGVSALPRAAR
jgi:hypothetical protein